MSGGGAGGVCVCALCICNIPASCHVSSGRQPPEGKALLLTLGLDVPLLHRWHTSFPVPRRVNESCSLAKDTPAWLLFSSFFNATE